KRNFRNPLTSCSPIMNAPLTAIPGEQLVNGFLKFRLLRRELACQSILGIVAALAGLGFVAHLVVMLRAQNDFNNDVEALVVLHSQMFAQGQGLYWSLNHYPYTIS